MRYQGWDVLIFPGNSKIPIQEFKTGCHVVQDHESASLVPGTIALPTVTCFIPGLPYGVPFRISVHCWDTPEISRYTQNYSKHPENVMYEARVFIDGKLSGRNLFPRAGQWPMIIESGLDRDRNGELEDLKFPSFHAELLTQTFWNAGDDLGRIKITMSEGFPRDSMTMPIERVKNVVSFSFQHAPLDVLESSQIAWPNPAMWRQLPFSAYLTQHVSPHKYYEEAETHSHSPRRKPASLPAPPVPFTTMPPPPPYAPLFPRSSGPDPFYDNPSNRRKASSTTSGDTSMPDYGTYHMSHAGSGPNNSRRVTDLQELQDFKQLRDLKSAGAYEKVVESLDQVEAQSLFPAAPANTPMDGATPLTGMKTTGRDCQDTPELDNVGIDPSLRKSVFENEIRSKKENHPDTPRPHDYVFASNEGTSRNASGTFTTINNSGSKRPYKAIEEFEEPRLSPASRKVSLALGGIENIR